MMPEMEPHERTAWAEMDRQIARLRCALKAALPHLEESFRWHRDMQSHASKVAAVSDALDLVRDAIANGQ